MTHILYRSGEPLTTKEPRPVYDESQSWDSFYQEGFKGKTKKWLSTFTVPFQDKEAIRIALCESPNNPQQKGPNTYQWQPPDDVVYTIEAGIEFVEVCYCGGMPGVCKKAKDDPSDTRRQCDVSVVARLKRQETEPFGNEREDYPIIKVEDKATPEQGGKWDVTQNQFGICLLELKIPNKETRWMRPTGITKTELQAIADKLNAVVAEPESQEEQKIWTEFWREFVRPRKVSKSKLKGKFKITRR